jgi:hypothetical protein
VNRPLVGTMVMSVLLVIYLGFTANYAWILVKDPQPLVMAMGYALIVLPILGVWGLVAEMRFAIASQKLMTRLEAEKLMPDAELPRQVSGRPNRDTATENFPQFARAVEANPDSWQAWLRLGLAYDACGDRRRARWAVRRALVLGKVG